jgi:hypothetical protein
VIVDGRVKNTQQSSPENLLAEAGEHPVCGKVIPQNVYEIGVIDIIPGWTKERNPVDTTELLQAG